MFLPGRWPAYFTRTKGCRVWDLDANEYLDIALMGVGTNLLGTVMMRWMRLFVRS